MRRSDSGAAARQLEAARQELVEIEREEPLRRRILVALSDAPSTPTQLSRATGSPKESVSRKLAELRESGLVATTRNADDGRRIIYALTRTGRVEHGRHLAFGQPDPPPPAPNAGEVSAFLREALAGAVAMRRRSNRLLDAIDRLTEINKRAVALGDLELAVETQMELATTQRQHSLVDEWHGSLKELETLAMDTPALDHRLAFRAMAYREYQRGKSTENGTLDRYLIASLTSFEQLIEKSPSKDTALLRTRKAWSMFGIAHVFRERSRFEDALRIAATSLLAFNELDDDYGRSQCWFLLGYCLRLLGRFELAWQCLERAHGISIEPHNSFERITATSLQQMGEVRRCLGDFDEAEQLLSEAGDAAARLNLHLAGAFVSSSSAALKFERGDLGGAQAILKEAQERFEESKHPEGIALNSRRQATVARHLWKSGVNQDSSMVRSFIETAKGMYETLRSPAGVAACDIEGWQISQVAPRFADSGQIVKRLNKLVSSDVQTLCKDVWISPALQLFADQTDSPWREMIKQTCSSTLQGREQQISKDIQPISTLMGHRNEPRNQEPSVAVIEMGGESRRENFVRALG